MWTMGYYAGINFVGNSRDGLNDIFANNIMLTAYMSNKSRIYEYLLNKLYP